MNTIYKPINPIERAGSEPLNELKISVRYDKGSMNYFNGQVNKRGLYVHFSPVHRGNGFESCTMLSGNRREDGFKIFVRELGRASQKQTDYVFSRVEPLADAIAKKWNTEDWDDIFKMVKLAV